MTKHVVDVQAVFDDSTGQVTGFVITGIPGMAPVTVGSSTVVAAPASLTSLNAAQYNGQALTLAAGATLTVDGSAWAGIPAGIAIQVGQSGSATLAFSGTATKENASGTSAASVTLTAASIYAVTQSPSGTPKFRLAGGAAL